MASQFAILAFAVLVAFPSVTFAMQWTVGDDKGWTSTYGNYSEWAKDKMFYLGDSLLFNYPVGLHNVFKISNATDFQHCVIPPANQAFTSGHDVIDLLTPGVKWYICGIGQHCATYNQKLRITVLDVERPAAAPAPQTGNTADNSTSGTAALVSSTIKILVAAVVALVLISV